MKKIITLSLLMLIAPALIAEDLNTDEIAARIAPVGHVTVSGAASTIAKTEAAAGAPKIITAEETYKSHCSLCHAAGVAGAPKFHDAATWGPRMKKGLDGLLKSAIAGLNAMPPRGTCAECNDAQLKEVIAYMIPHK